jgi:hypothetical protein
VGGVLRLAIGRGDGAGYGVERKGALTVAIFVGVRLGVHRAEELPHAFQLTQGDGDTSRDRVSKEPLRRRGTHYRLGEEGSICCAADVNFHLLFILSRSSTNMAEDGDVSVTTAFCSVPKRCPGARRSQAR